MWKLFVMNPTRLTALTLMLCATLPRVVAQSEALTVCQMLKSTPEHSEVIVTGEITGESHHGYFLSEALGSDPCPGWRRQLFTAPAAAAIVITSSFGVSLTNSEQQSNREFIHRLGALNGGHPVKYKVTIKGVLARKPWPMMFRRADGTYFSWGRTDLDAIAIFIPKSVLAEGN
jgi:hypothetical protein